jgi:hypothetical protein
MIRVILGLLFGSVLLLPVEMAAQTPDQSMNSTAAQLAARISSLLPRRATVSLELQNLTQMPGAQWSSFRKLLQDELGKAGVETAGAGTQPESGQSSSPSRVRITLSENARGLLLVAEVFTGDNRQIAMLPWGLPARAQSKPRITLAQKLFWTAPEPILDMLLVDSDSQMLILDAGQIVSFRWMGNKWTPSATASLVLPRPMPRDPRGRLEATAGEFEAFLPVATCRGAWNPELKLTCLGGTANWPGTFGTHWASNRNFLEGDAPAPNFADRASIANPCGVGTVDIASSLDDEHDSVRVWDGADPASDALPLPGPVTALWPAESPGQATLVVRNLQTGQYEASRLGLACTE